MLGRLCCLPTEKEQINQVAAERAEGGQLVLIPGLHSQSESLVGINKIHPGCGGEAVAR